MAFHLDPTDRAFARYRRSGDPAALGVVFDRTATELLRIAVWLAGNRTDAEDLLQRTFLTAIEARERFDERQRVLPWLCGILTNLARSHKRAQARERALLRPPQSEPDPAQTAVEGELRQRLDTLRQELGSPYREVLELHLERGLNARQIAAELGRPAGTVRTQLVRAQELLRRRLPDGFVAAVLPALPVLPDATALLGVRAAVLGKAHAAAGATASSVAATGGVLAMTGSILMAKKLSVLVPFLALVLGLVGYAVWPRSAPLLDPSFAGSAPARPVPQSAPGVAAPSTAPATRQAVAGPVVTAPDPSRAAILLTVHWDDDDGVAAGVAAEVEFESLASPATRCRAVTGADGTCVLGHLLPGRWRLSLSHGGQTTVALAAGEQRAVTLGTHRSAVAQGEVVDPDGRPVADARICLSLASYGWHEAARSDAQGRFAVAVCEGVLVGARKAGFAPSFEVPAVAPDGQRITLRLRAQGGAVRGTVRDPRGALVARAPVLVGPKFGFYRSRRPQEAAERWPQGETTWTDEQGVFQVAGIDPGRVEVQVWAAGFAPWRGIAAVDAGQTAEVAVVLTPGATVRGQVRDADHQPVAGATVTLGIHIEFVHVTTEAGADGSFVLTDLPAGSVTLRAQKERAEAGTTLTLDAGQTTTWDAVLARAAGIDGLVLGPDGRPFAGASVGWSGPQSPMPAAYERTGDDGRFRLEDVGSEAVSLEVELPGLDCHRTVREGVAPGTHDVLIQLTAEDLPSARLRGRAVDERGQPIAVQLSALRTGQVRCSVLDNDASTGKFELGPMPAGQVTVTLHSKAFGTRVLEALELAAGETRDLGDVVFPRAGSASFTVRVPELMATHGRGAVCIYTERGAFVARVDLDRARGRIEPLAPGRYVVTCDFGSRRTGADLVVESGVESRLDLEPQEVVRGTVTFRDPSPRDGTSVAVVVRRVDGTFVGMAGTMRRPGPLQCPLWLAPGRYRLDCTVSDGRRLTGEVTLQAGRDLQQSELTLPAR